MESPTLKIRNLYKDKVSLKICKSLRLEIGNFYIGYYYASLEQWIVRVSSNLHKRCKKERQGREFESRMRLASKKLTDRLCSVFALLG